MDGPAGDPQEETIGELVGRLVEDGRAYAEAEVALYKAIALHRGQRARKALVALAVGGALLFFALAALVIAAMVSLTALVGPLLAGVLVGVPLAAIGWLLVRIGWSGIKGLGCDPAEREALERGETLP